MRREQYENTVRPEIFSWVWGNHTHLGRENRIQEMGERAENKTE